MKLIDYLKSNGMTAREFAFVINRSEATVSRILHGRNRPDWETLDAILHHTNGAVTPNDFIAGDGP